MPTGQAEAKPEAQEDDAKAREQQASQGPGAAEQAAAAEADQRPADAAAANEPVRSTNPLRDLGSAQEQWRRDFAVVEDAADEQEGQRDTGDVEAPRAGDEVEFAKPDDAAAKQQALAAATQEQAEQQAAAGPPQEAEQAPEEGLAAAEAAEEVPEEDRMQAEDAVPAADAAAVQGGSREAKGPAEGAAASQEEAEAMSSGEEEAGRAQEANFARVELNEEPVGGDVEMADAQASGDHMAEQSTGGGGDSARGHALWQKCYAATAALTGELVEQLRLVLAPTQASRLSGEFKMGKRLNMKKVIRYIASSYRQDRIWMRRATPDKRQYQVLLAIDDTKSMQVRRCLAMQCPARHAVPSSPCSAQLTLAICRRASAAERGERTQRGVT